MLQNLLVRNCRHQHSKTSRLKSAGKMWMVSGCAHWSHVRFSCCTFRQPSQASHCNGPSFTAATDATVVRHSIIDRSLCHSASCYCCMTPGVCCCRFCKTRSLWRAISGSCRGSSPSLRPLSMDMSNTSHSLKASWPGSMQLDLGPVTLLHSCDAWTSALMAATDQICNADSTASIM